MHRDERLEHEVVAGAQVRALMVQDRRNLRLTQHIERTLAEHHAAAHTGQAVGHRLGHAKDSDVIVPAGPHQVDHHPVAGAAPPRPDGHRQHRHHQAGTDQ